MPVPPEYQRATEEFYRFLRYAKEASGLATTHQAYTMAQGVLQVFRRRLDVPDAVRFAGALPAVLRAIFVADWDTKEPRRLFGDRAAMAKEVRELRADHNFAPDTAIGDVAAALRKCVDGEIFDRVLSTLPEGAVRFWRP